MLRRRWLPVCTWRRGFVRLRGRDVVPRQLRRLCVPRPEQQPGRAEQNGQQENGGGKLQRADRPELPPIAGAGGGGHLSRGTQPRDRRGAFGADFEVRRGRLAVALVQSVREVIGGRIGSQVIRRLVGGGR